MSVLSQLETRSLSEELMHSSVDLMFARESMKKGDRSMTREEPDGSSTDEKPDAASEIVADLDAVDAITPKVTRKEDIRMPMEESVLVRDEPDGAQEPQPPTTVSAPTAVPTHLNLKAEVDEETPTVSPTQTSATLLGSAPTTRPHSTCSDGVNDRSEATPRSSPLLSRNSSSLSRHSATLSERLDFLQSTPRPLSPNDSLPELDDNGIPIPPPAPTPQSLSEFLFVISTEIYHNI